MFRKGKEHLNELEETRRAVWRRWSFKKRANNPDGFKKHQRLRQQAYRKRKKEERRQTKKAQRSRQAE